MMNNKSFATIIFFTLIFTSLNTIQISGSNKSNLIIKSADHDSVSIEKLARLSPSQNWNEQVTCEVGDRIYFKIVVNNTYCFPIDPPIFINDTLPSNLIYSDNATPREPDEITDNILSWKFMNPIDPEEGIEITFQATATSLGDSYNLADVTGSSEGEEFYYEDTAYVNVEIGDLPPNPPILIEPGTDSDTGYAVETLTPTFRWNAVNDAEFYAIYISEYPYGTNNLVYDSEEDYSGGKIYGTSFNELPGNILEYGKKYRWNMRAHNTNGWSLFSDHLYFEVPDIPQCSLKLKKEGSEIHEIDVRVEFDIQVCDYTSNIDKVRFLSDEEWNNWVDDGFAWTEWFEWDTNSEGWDAENKIKKWSFSSGGEKEIHIEVKDDIGRVFNCACASIYTTFYFVHITDIHVKHELDIMPGNYYLDLERSEQKWNDILNKINSFEIPPEFVIASGDLVDAGGGTIGETNYQSFVSPLFGSNQDWYVDSRKKIPIYFCPGNHDYRNALIDEFGGHSIPGAGDNLENYQNYVGEPYLDSYSVIDDSNKIAIISLNSGHDVFSEGTYFPPRGTGFSDGQMTWLEDQLDDLDGIDNNIDTSEYRKIIVMHHPVIYYRKDWKIDQWDAGCITSYKERFLDDCDQYDVDVVLSGHTHINRVYNRDMDGEPLFWEGYNNLPISQHNKPLYVITGSNLEDDFRIIEIKQDEIVINKEKYVKDSFKAEIKGCPVELHLYDEYGNHVGRNSSNGVDFEIENVSYSFDPLFITNETDPSKWNHTIEEISIPYGNGKYTFVMKGTGNGDFNFSTTNQLSDGNRTYLYYNNISIFQNSIGKMNIDGESVDPIIYFDDDGDGNNDREIKPDYFYGNDNSNPNIQILKPENKFYFRNKEIFSFPIPWILGRIEIEIDAFDNISGINYVKIFIDDELKANITSGDLVFNWEEKTFGKHTIKAVAYDYVGNSAVDSVIVRKFF